MCVLYVFLCEFMPDYSGCSVLPMLLSTFGALEEVCQNEYTNFDGFVVGGVLIMVTVKGWLVLHLFVGRNGWPLGL